jgi:predicted DNA-binding transcriptional regulator AlpA
MDQVSQNHLTGFLRLDQVLKLIPVSKATWWNGCKSGQFPKPYKLGPRITAWKVMTKQYQSWNLGTLQPRTAPPV